MKYNFLGNTGLLVSELCFGTMTFGGSGMWEHIGKVKQDEVNHLIKEVVNSGINFIDTADVYSFGESETLLGQAIKDLGLNRNELVISTKVFGRMDDKPNSVGLSRYHVFNAVNDSLKRLQLDHIDILYVHGFDVRTPLEEVMRTLNDIVLSGKVRYIAVCNWSAWAVAKAQGVAERMGWSKFVGLQYFYSLSGRDIEREVVPMALDHNLPIMPWSPLAGGILSGKYTRDTEKVGNSRRDVFDFPPVNKEKTYDIIDVIIEIGKDHHASAAQIALAWVRQQPGVTSTVIGAKRVEQLQDNVKSVDIVLSAEELVRIDDVSALNKEYPQWMIDHYGQDRDQK